MFNPFHLSDFKLFILIFTIFWVLPWKAYSLWLAAHSRQKIWFVVLLVVNTFSILELVYVFYIEEKKVSDIKHALKNLLK